MESQKIKYLLDHKDETYSKCQTKKWYIINDRNNGQYDEGNDKGVKIDAEVVKPFLCDYADAYILVTGDITVEGGDDDTKFAFKNCHPFTKSVIHLNDEYVEDSDNLDIIMNMCNLIEYSDNYSDFTASLYHFKRQEPLANNAALTDASFSFKYKSGLLGESRDGGGGNRIWKNVQIIVPLKYVSSFLRSLEMPLINTTLYIQLNYTKHSITSTADNYEPTTFKIAKTQLYVPVVTLNTEDNNKLNELLLKSETDSSVANTKSKDNKFKRTVYWNEYKSKIEDVTQPENNTTFKRTLLDTGIPEVNRLKD